MACIPCCALRCSPFRPWCLAGPGVLASFCSSVCGGASVPGDGEARNHSPTGSESATRQYSSPSARGHYGRRSGGCSGGVKWRAGRELNVSRLRLVVGASYGRRTKGGDETVEGIANFSTSSAWECTSRHLKPFVFDEDCCSPRRRPARTFHTLDTRLGACQLGPILQPYAMLVSHTIIHSCCPFQLLS